MPTRINYSWWRGREESFRLNVRCGNAQLTSGIFSLVPQGRSCLTEKQASTIGEMTAFDGHQTWILCSSVSIFNKTPDSLPDLIFLFFFGLEVLTVWCKHHCLITNVVMHSHKDWACTVLFYWHTWSGKLDCVATLQAAVSVVLNDIVKLVSISLFFAAMAFRCYFVAV